MSMKNIVKVTFVVPPETRRIHWYVCADSIESALMIVGKLVRKKDKAAFVVASEILTDSYDQPISVIESDAGVQPESDRRVILAPADGSSGGIELERADPEVASIAKNSFDMDISGGDK